MEYYKSIYKCRLCGKIFIGQAVSLGSAAGIAGRLTNEDNFSQGDIHGSRYATHNCEDGSFGFSDFRGFRKVGE